VSNWEIKRRIVTEQVNVTASNPGFSSSAIEEPPSGCGLCMMTAGGVRDRTTIWLTKQLRDEQK
jgi:hypothetical protein